MGHYFEDDQSLFASAGPQVRTALDRIVKRYLRANPPLPLTYRAYSRRGILRGKDYRYIANFNSHFPHARDGQYVYAWAKYCSDGPTTLMADVSCFGPMAIHLNGTLIFKSDIFSERYTDKRNRITL